MTYCFSLYYVNSLSNNLRPKTYKEHKSIYANLV